MLFEGTKRTIKIRCNISFDVLKRKIHDKLKLYSNQVILFITSRFIVSEKYVALHIYDDEDVKIIICAFLSTKWGSNIRNVC